MKHISIKNSDLYIIFKFNLVPNYRIILNNFNLKKNYTMDFNKTLFKQMVCLYFTGDEKKNDLIGNISL